MKIYLCLTALAVIIAFSNVHGSQGYISKDECSEREWAKYNESENAEKSNIRKRALRPIWWLNRRDNEKRSLMDIKLDKPATVSEKAGAAGDALMKDFMLYLTLKDSGMLDYCLGR